MYMPNTVTVYNTAQGTGHKAGEDKSAVREGEQHMTRINILGTEYTITIKMYSEDENFERSSICGYCDALTREIVVCDMATFPGWEHEPERKTAAAQKETLRHEIVHAFFDESGLRESAAKFDGAWSQFEELVDWIAIQGPKIYAAWREAGALEG